MRVVVPDRGGLPWTAEELSFVGFQYPSGSCAVYPYFTAITQPNDRR